jgi:Family of unknown function (DUF6507)
MAPLPKPDYDINPRGVDRVLKSLDGPIDELNAAGKTLNANLPDAALQSQSALVAEALEAFMDHYDWPLRQTAALVEGAPKGAYKATVAYIHGDREMFERAQRSPDRGVERARSDWQREAAESDPRSHAEQLRWYAGANRS